MKYVYHFIDGTTYDIELADNWVEVLKGLDHKEHLNNRRESRRHQSLDRLLELDDFLIVSKAPDPLGLLIEKEQARQINPLFKVLTKRQRLVSIMYHVKRYKKVEIAKKLKINKSSVVRLLQRADKAIVDFMTKP